MEKVQMSKGFTCSVCSSNFTKKCNLNKHMLNIHRLQGELSGKMVCPLADCLFRCHNRRILREHLHDPSIHNVTMYCYKKQFKTVEGFYSWKTAEEEATNSCFVMKNGPKKTPGEATKMYFICHRSGFFVSHGTGKRERRRKATCKINATCPAGIEIVIEKSKVAMVYHKTHLGHNNDVEHIKLNKKEKTILIDKIIQGLSFNKIIEDIKREDSFENRRIKLITRKDLHNLVREFKFPIGEKSNDLIRVDEWVNQLKDYTGSPVVIYKPQGCVEPTLQLYKKDFMLCIITDWQKRILEKLPKLVVYVDITQDSNAHGFFLITVSILSNCDSPFPIAYCITNRTDNVGMITFFASIKNQMGAIDTLLFISDDMEIYRNAWESIMCKPERSMFSASHTKTSWKNHLYKIHNMEKQGIVYKLILSLLEEENENAFQTLLNSFITYLDNDVELYDFGVYFKNTYAYKVEMWAFCFCKIIGCNTYEHVEKMHTTINSIYFDENIPKNMDSCIHGLLQMTHDTVLEHFCVLHKDSEVVEKEILKKHKVSEQIVLSNVEHMDNADMWLLKYSDSDDSTYTVGKKVSVSETCKLYCSLCEVCLHWYFCNCVDYLIENEICEHVHAIARLFGTKYESITCDEVVDFTVPLIDNSNTLSPGALDESSPRASNALPLNESDKLKNNLSVLLNYSQSTFLPENEYKNVQMKLEECLKIFQSTSSQ